MQKRRSRVSAAVEIRCHHRRAAVAPEDVVAHCDGNAGGIGIADQVVRVLVSQAERFLTSGGSAGNDAGLVGLAL